MLYISMQDQWQHNSYEQGAPNTVRTRTDSGTTMGTFHTNMQTHDYATEIMNELGTTDTAIGDATAEIMITTIGKIPKEMYYVDDTTVHAKSFPHETTQSGLSVTNSSFDSYHDITKKTNSTGLGHHSTVFLILIITLLVLLLLCCITACIISRTKKRHTYFRKCGFQQCDIECRGVKQPLLSPEKLSGSTSKTSNSSLKN